MYKPNNTQTRPLVSSLSLFLKAEVQSWWFYFGNDIINTTLVEMPVVRRHKLGRLLIASRNWRAGRWPWQRTLRTIMKAELPWQWDKTNWGVRWNRERGCEVTPHGGAGCASEGDHALVTMHCLLVPQGCSRTFTLSHGAVCLPPSIWTGLGMLWPIEFSGMISQVL